MSEEDLSLTLEARDVTGKAVKQLRKQGMVPAVIHDHGKASVNVMAEYLKMYRAYKQAGRHHALQLKVGNKSYTALIKTAEFEPHQHRLNHIVFGAVSADEKVTAEIPVRLSDDIPAEKVSLIVITQLDTVEVEAIPSNLPDELVIDASTLIEIGDKITVADIVPPKGVTILTEAEHTIATVYEPSALAAANDAAGGTAEPEDAKSVEAEAGEAEESGATTDETESDDKQAQDKAE